MDAVTLTVSLPQVLDMGLGEKEGQLELNSQYLSLTNWAIRQIQPNFMLEDTLTSSVLGLSNSLLVSKTRKCFPIYSITDSHRMTSREFHGKEGVNCWFIISPSFWQAQVRPKCGRLVAFSSGEENPHGVWAVTRGRRCAIALWYTLSQEHAEQVTKHRRGRRGGNGPKSIGKIKSKGCW